jgi:hypothetical protein
MITEPEKWVVLEFTGNTPHHYKVFASWSGSYLQGNSWKLNSGIKSLEETKNTWIFQGYSGSEYHCPKPQYGITNYGAVILESLIKKAKKQGVKIKVLPHQTCWNKLPLSETPSQ